MNCKIIVVVLIVMAFAFGFNLGRIWWVFSLKPASTADYIYKGSDLVHVKQPACEMPNDVLVEFVWTKNIGTAGKPVYLCGDIEQYEVFTNRFITRHIQPLRGVSR